MSQQQPVMQQPSPPTFVMKPPPVMHSGQHQHVAMPTHPGPPPMQQMQMQQMPPTPVIQQPVVPQQPQMPSHMIPYQKMKKFGVGPAAIMNKMKANGDDPSDYDIYLGDGKASGGGPPPQRTQQPPRKPRPQLVIPTQPVLRSTPTPTKPKRGGGILDAIRAGAQLKKAVHRPKPPPQEPTGRDAMLAAIQGGAMLKKAANRQLAEAEPEEANDNILAFLQLRVAIQGDSSSEDEDSDWDDDSS